MKIMHGVEGAKFPTEPPLGPVTALSHNYVVISIPADTKINLLSS